MEKVTPANPLVGTLMPPSIYQQAVHQLLGHGRHPLQAAHAVLGHHGGVCPWHQEVSCQVRPGVGTGSSQLGDLLAGEAAVLTDEVCRVGGQPR